VTVTLAESYRECRRLSRRYGTTYHWSTYGLPRLKRHHVWALYAFCRCADDIVDEQPDRSIEVRRRELDEFAERFLRDWARGRSDHPVLKAVVHTVRAFDHDTDAFCRFIRSMSMDLTVASYATWDDLLVYMDGSAAVIGEMMLPILEPSSPDAVGPARDLGLAFQLTNFLRDVDEDLDRGRIYLPLADLEQCGADPHRRVADDRWAAVMELEIARCRELYESADRGIDMLPPAEARCIRAARQLYSGILDEIEAHDYDVFHGRVAVPERRKVAAAARLAVLSGR
jgi:phytoene synthase